MQRKQWGVLATIFFLAQLYFLWLVGIWFGYSDITTNMGLVANIKATIYASFGIMFFIFFLASMICGLLQKDTHEITFSKKEAKKK